jgi:hypothetical protein
MENTKPNIYILCAAGLMLLTAFAHTFPGTVEFMGPLRRSDLPDVPMAGFAVIWNWVTAMLFGSAASIAWLSKHKNPALFWAVMGAVVSFGLIFASIAVTELGSLFALPQWIAFIGTAMLMGLGLRKS